MQKLILNLRVLLLCLLLAAPILLRAATVTVDQGVLRYTVDTGAMTAEVSGLVNSSATIIDLVIPDYITYNGKKVPVTAIGNFAFEYCESLTSVTIPESVTSIGWSAFNNCSSLASVTIPESVTSIESSAFEFCPSLISVTIPEGVTSIGACAFFECSSLTSVTIPESVTSIGNKAFESCSSLTSVTIPEGVTSIGAKAFYDCSALTELIFNAENCATCGSFIWYNWYPAFPETVRKLILGNKVGVVPDYAFQNLSSLTSVTIPEAVTSIGIGAFDGCLSLTELIFNAENCTGCGSSQYPSFPGAVKKLIIGNNVESIPDYAFQNCSSLTSVTIPEGVTSIGIKAFNGCSSLTELIFNAKNCTECGSSQYPSFPGAVKNLIIGNNVESIPDYAFQNCSSLTSVTIPEGVTSIGINAFNGCSSLTELIFNAKNCTECGSWDSPAFPETIGSLILGNKVGIIPGDAFRGLKSLTSVTIPESVTTIGDHAFVLCSSLKELAFNAENCTECGSSQYPAFPNTISKLSLGDKVGIIPDEAFRGLKSLTSVTIPESVTSIGTSAFYGCSSLLSVTIPESVTSIGTATFAYCSYLRGVTIPESVTEIGPSAFAHCSYLKSVTIPKNMTSIEYGTFAYCSALSSVTIPESVTSIGEGAFGYCRSLKSVTIPESVTTIGEKAFCGCSSLESVTIPERVTTIGNNAFIGCSSLTSVTIPESVTSIGEATFANCSSLMSVTIPESVTEIGTSAFHSCSSLESVTIPEGVTSIGTSAFFGCSSLTSVTIPESVTTIGEATFANCSSLMSVTLPGSMIAIGKEVFYACSSLESVTIPESVKSIEYGTFAYCSSLTSVTISESVTAIGEGSFGYCSSLTSVTIPESVTTIGDKAFVNCSSLSSVSIPPKVSSIGTYAFYGCSKLVKNAYPSVLSNPFPSGVSIAYPVDCLIDEQGCIYNDDCLYYAPIDLTASYNFPEGVTSIGDHAFYACSSLESMAIPEGVTSIGDKAFSECSAITDVYYSAERPVTANSNIFSQETYNTATLWVPENAVSLYERIEPWRNFYDIQPYDFNSKVDITISLSEAEKTLKEKETFLLTANVTPETDEKIEWRSSDETVVTVSDSGLVTAISPGVAIISASAGDVTATCTITVEPTLATSITLDITSKGAVVGEEFRLTATVLPEDASSKTVEWTSSDENVATVDTTGKVKVVGLGVCVITATTTDGSDLSATCELTSTTGIADISGEEGRVDIYTLTGVLLHKDMEPENLKRLEPGIYIVRNGSETRKIVVK